MNITKEQYKLLNASVEKVIKEAIGESFNEDIYEEFVFCVLGEYKENEYTLKSIFTDFIDENDKIEWEDWEKDVLEAWEDVCRFDIGDDEIGVAANENIWYAMQSIPDIIKNILQIT